MKTRRRTAKPIAEPEPPARRRWPSAVAAGAALGLAVAGLLGSPRDWRDAFAAFTGGPASPADEAEESEPPRLNPPQPPGPAAEGMVWVPGGEFFMGAEPFHDEELGREVGFADAERVHRVYVNGFWMDRTEATNAQFARFVQETGYVTVAERKPSARDFPRAAPEELVPASIVFTPPDGPVDLDEHLSWWRLVPGADWRHPEGPDSTLAGRDNHPVVHVSWEDVV